MTVLGRSLRAWDVPRVAPLHVLILLVAAGLAWAWTVEAAWGMGSMPGTMGRDLAAFLVMWALMMSAMMIPSAAPFAVIQTRTFRERRAARVTLFVLGYLAVWAASGLPAFGLARAVDEAVAAAPAVGTGLAVAVFAACGVYQLSPWKYACLRHCRSPMHHVLHYASYRGGLRDLRVGIHHGAYCLACCWSLMVLLAAFGFMNLWAMLALTAVVGVEKYWLRGEGFARVVGVTALALAVAVVWEPGLAPGLQPMEMSVDMGTGLGGA